MSGRTSSVSPGSSPSTGTHSPESIMSYQFVNLKDPNDTKDSKVRRAIRSHVTKQQHHKAEQLAAAKRWNNETQLGETSQKQSGRAPAPTPSSSRPAIGSQQSSKSSVGGSGSYSSNTSQHATLDLSRIYPPQWLPYLNPVFENYVAYTAREILHSDDVPTRELLWTTWIPFVMSDLALLHAVLLFAGSLFNSSRARDAQILDLLQLKDMAIKAMNESLSTSDSMIAAMAAMAQYEAFWRDASAFSMHMSGLQQFVKMRGGLAALGLNGFLERMLMATDDHTAHITGLDTTLKSSEG